jgi:hypothetical protein
MSDSQRQAWTKFVEQREREKKARPPREAKKTSAPRGATSPEKAFVSQCAAESTSGATFRQKIS